MRHVLCRLGEDVYAVPCGSVERIVPFATLKELPGGVRGLAGLLNYQGHSVPVVDLALLLTGQASREVRGTRILLCPLPATPSGRIGLLVEGTSEVRDLAEDAFAPAGAKGEDCLAGVISSEGRLLQRISIPQILPPEVLASLEWKEEREP